MTTQTADAPNSRGEISVLPVNIVLLALAAFVMLGRRNTH